MLINFTVCFRELLDSPSNKCRNSPSSSSELKFSACGTYNLSFYGRAGNEKASHGLGNITVSLPHFTKLEEKERGPTWTKLKFGFDNGTCWPNHTYTVRCGSLTFNVTEDENVVVYNLFPSMAYTCSYWLAGSSAYGQNVSIYTARSPFYDYAHSVPFSAHDDGIFLRKDGSNKWLVNSNISVTIRATDLSTNETFTTVGLDAFQTGVAGLKSSTHYEACLILEQKEGCCTFDCRNDTECFKVTTLPHLSPHWMSLTGLWIVCGLLFLLFLALAVVIILVWMRLNAIGAPSSKLAWIQLRKRTYQDQETLEEAAIMKVHHEKTSADVN